MRMFSKVLSAVAALTLAGAAHAADLPTRKAPVAPAPITPAFTWGGFYVGGFVGGNWSKVTTNDITFPNFFGVPALSSNGITGGGLAGYNYQFNQFVIGAEGEFGYDGLSSSSNFLTGGGATRNVAFSGNFEGRLRGRVGYTFDRVLLFVAGGGSLNDIKATYTNPFNGFSQQITHLRGGFNIGGGVEWAFANNWTIRGEYIYDGFAARSYDFRTVGLANGIAGPFDNFGEKLQQSTARAVLSYKF